MVDAKLLSLVVLTVQNTCLVLTMRISRTRTDVPMYLASVAVMTDELMKLVVCTVMLVLAYKASAKYQLVTHQTERETQLSMTSFLRFFKSEVCRTTFDFVKMCVPAFLYAVQKNLLYVAISNLDAAVFQVAYQGKILTTALFSVIVLGKRMTKRQVFALFILLAGVALVQLSSLDSSGETKSDNVMLGSLAVLGACFTSGFAAIYFEWVLKKSPPQEQTPHSLWVRNFQLATFAFAAAAFGVMSRDGAAVAEKGLYQGFTPLVWFVVAMEAFGGIVVALVIKYADNILKNFATAVSIVTSVIVSALFLGFVVKLSFVVGAVCVMSAVALYTSNPKAALFSRAKGKEEDEPAVTKETELANSLKPRVVGESEKAEI
jgi:UDP-sugar transporter A1/2/3